MKVYLIHFNKGPDFSTEVEEIKNINPDKILLFCFQEMDAEYIFRDLFPILSPWLVENNKFANVLLPGPDGYALAPNIITEKTFGLQIELNQRYLKKINNMGFDFNNTYLHSTKLFTCYNKSPKYHRACTIDMLAKANLLDDGVVTFYDVPESIQRDQIMYGSKAFRWEYHNGSILKDEDIFIEPSGRPNYDSMTDEQNHVPTSYLKGFLDVVTETQYKHNHYFLTEKTARSLVFLKPFLCVSSPGFHSYLKDEYGIEPYTEIFDYSFDWCDNLLDRINGVVENLLKIKSTFSIEQRNRIHELLLPKMQENKKRLFEYSVKKEKMIPKSLKFTTEGKKFTLYGHISQCFEVFDYYERNNWYDRNNWIEK